MYQASVSDINAFLVRDAIRERGEVTRTELSVRLGLSPASVSRIVRSLVEDGVVTEMSTTPSSGPGRRSDVIRFNNRSGGVIAVDLGGTKCHGVLADLGAQTLSEDYRPTHADGSPSKSLIATIDALRRAAADARLPVHAVVVGVPAVPDPDTGFVGSGPNVNWEDFDLIGLLKGHLDEPFRIENDVTLAAIGQAWRGEGEALQGFVTLSIGTGIGAATFANGQILRGRHNQAGEIGSLLMGREQLHAEPGTVAGLESVASGPVIARRARELLESGKSSSLQSEDLTTRHVFEAALASDPLALKVIDEVLDHVAMTMIDIAAMIDPERIILDGSVGRALEPFAAGLEERMSWRVKHVPLVQFSRLGPNATVIGAIAGALTLDREMEARKIATEIPDDGLRALASLPAYGGPEDQASGRSPDGPGKVA